MFSEGYIMVTLTLNAFTHDVHVHFRVHIPLWFIGASMDGRAGAGWCGVDETREEQHTYHNTQHGPSEHTHTHTLQSG